MGEAERRLRVRGRDVSLPAGAPLLAALGRGRELLQRSIRYHRPRAPFCGLGHCTNCLVRVNGVPNVRACTYHPNDGDRVRTENSWPSPSFDVNGVLDLLLPNGVDTLTGFRRPRFATPAYQWVVRRLSGFGTPPTPPTPAGARPPAEVRAVDTLVIGAGRSGRTIAHDRRSNGRSVELIDRSLGGEETDGAVTHWGHTAVFLPPPNAAAPTPFRLVSTTEKGGAVEFRAREVIVAVGGYDAGLWFSGGDRPGVMTGDGAVAFAALAPSPPFRRALLVGSGARAREILSQFRGSFEAVCAPGTIPPDLVGEASSQGVDLYPRSLLLEARGRSRLRSARLAPRGGGAPFELAVDAIVLAHRRLPNLQLLFQAGASMRFDRAVGAYYPVVTEGGATSVPGLSVVGSCAGPTSIGAEAAPPAERPAASDVPGPFEGYYRELLARPHPRGKFVVCACEDVLLSEVEEAHAKGYRGIEVVKRFTGLGTGLCQGRYCVPDALLALAVLEGRSPAEVGYLTQRPPVVPSSLGALSSLAPSPAAEE